MDATDQDEVIITQPVSIHVEEAADVQSAPVESAQTPDDIQTAPSEDVISQEQPPDVTPTVADLVAQSEPIEPTLVDEPEIVEDQAEPVSEYVPPPPYKSAAALREEFRVKAKQGVREALAAQPHRGTPAFADLLAVSDAIVDAIAST